LDVLFFKRNKRVIMVEKTSSDSMGMVKNPNRSMYFSVQDTPWLQGCSSWGIIPE
jgi:hypothetical protein